MGRYRERRRFRRFNLAIEMLFISGAPRTTQKHQHRFSVSISQSRCFSFQDRRHPPPAAHCTPCFNLAIERLFISGAVLVVEGACCPGFVSISQSRCFSFQVAFGAGGGSGLGVSISQSRCFSFQESLHRLPQPHVVVSISQSRCFSFQEKNC